MNAEQKHFRKGEIIFREGDFELWMFDIQFGKVGFYSEYGAPGQVLINTLDAPTFVGDWGFFESMPRKNTAVALEDCVAYVINHDNLTQYFAERPQKIVQIIEVLCRKNRELSNDYVQACAAIAQYLEAENAGVEKPKGLIAKMKQFAASGLKALGRG